MSEHDTTPATPEDAELERRRRQRKRSVAIAVVLVALVVIFYITTILQMGANSGAPA